MAKPGKLDKTCDKFCLFSYGDSGWGRGRGFNGFFVGVRASLIILFRDES